MKYISTKDQTDCFVKKFSDGSLQVNLSNELMQEVSKGQCIELQYSIKNSDDLVSLLLIKDLITSINNKVDVSLYLSYMPYMRSDRKMDANTSFGLKTISRLINGAGFSEVIVEDPHSDVTEALINNLTIRHQSDLVLGFIKNLESYDYLISPDAGASKKVLALSKKTGIPFLEATKIRDIRTNQIIKTSILSLEDLRGKKVLVLDDIAEYGTTHHNLAKVLKEERGVAVADLYVTHGVLPMNNRQTPPSRTSFLQEYFNHLYVINLWGNSLEIDNNFVTFESEF